MDYRRNFFLLLLFLPSLLFADTGPWSGANTGDIILVGDTCYEMGSLINFNSSNGWNGLNYDTSWRFNSTYMLYFAVDCSSCGIGEWWSYNVVECPTDLDQDGYNPDDGDCNDTDATIFPGAPETCDDGIDQDCDGYDWNCADLDQDGYTPDDGDCDETNPDINPGAYEICGDSIDQDCDGEDSECQMVYTMTYDESINGLHGVAGLFCAVFFCYAIIKNS